MVQTIFYLPGYLKSNQKRLEELAAKYNLDLEKEIAEAEMNTEHSSDKKEDNLEKCIGSAEAIEPKKNK